jgi:hypothetical protein
MISDRRPCHAVKVYGERNTGTNYLSRLIASNFHVEALGGTVPPSLNRWMYGREALRDLYFRLTYRRNLGWKHRLVETPAALDRLGVVRRRRIGFVTLTKNPYSWLLSLHRQPYHVPSSKRRFDEFIVNPWEVVGREGASGPFPDPVELWNRKNAAYIPLRGLRAVTLRYEDLLADPEGVLGAIGDRFGIERRGSWFRDFEESTKSDGRKAQEIKEYYLNELWRSELTAESLALINERLEPSVMSAFGYDFIESITDGLRP